MSTMNRNWMATLRGTALLLALAAVMISLTAIAGLLLEHAAA